ncbi:hypothetical protein NM688_g6070 [Phlebia brevispora]|uniref:Uncharacterized protein n=1 Tax=Phlebia brevispora TaxID=194682 RepID=A0ACC1SKK6_9APHY|nr:hypothetical protein NM688_g6070 [Phlebia brevispora]
MSDDVSDSVRCEATIPDPGPKISRWELIPEVNLWQNWAAGVNADFELMRIPRGMLPTARRTILTVPKHTLSSNERRVHFLIQDPCLEILRPLSAIRHSHDLPEPRNSPCLQAVLPTRLWAERANTQEGTVLAYRQDSVFISASKDTSPAPPPASYNSNISGENLAGPNSFINAATPIFLSLQTMATRLPPCGHGPCHDFAQSEFAVSCISQCRKSQLTYSFECSADPFARPVVHRQSLRGQASVTPSFCGRVGAPTNAQAARPISVQRHKIKQTPYRPVNCSKRYAGAPPIKFMVNGCEGIRLADVLEDNLSHLEGASDPVFDPPSAKKIYHIQLRKQDEDYAISCTKNTRISTPGGRWQSINRAKVAQHVAELIAESDIFTPQEKERLILLEVRQVTKGSLQPELALEQGPTST